MNKRLIVVSLILVVVFGGVISIYHFTSQRVQARQAREAKSWEYCAIYEGGWVSGKGRGYASHIHFYQDTGIHIEEVEGANSQESVAKAFAKLGAEGWEMVGIDKNGAPCFKRPKP